MGERGRSDNLLNGPVIVVYPSLVRALKSMKDAAVLQQIHYRLQGPDAWESEEGGLWVSLRYVDLADEIGLSADQVRRAVEHLETKGVVFSCQPEHFNRRKAYRIDYEHEVLAPAESADPSGFAAASEGSARAASSSLQKEELLPAGAGADGGQNKPARARPRNPIFDALADVFPPATKSEQSRIGSVAAELAPMHPPPDLVRAVARLIRQEWPNATVKAVATHWTQFARRARAGPGGDDDARPGAIQRCAGCGELTIDCLCPKEPA